MSNDVLRAEHDEVLKTLSSRESTRQFAHASVSALIALMCGCTAFGLWNTGGAEREHWPLVAGACCVAVLYSVFRLLNGFRLNRIERTHLTRLIELRKSLGFELP